jgi:hypothetical protein
MTRLRYPMFVATILLVLVLSAISAAPVLADEGAPPVETASEEAPAAEEAADEAAPAADEEGNTSSSTDPASVTDEAPAVEEILEQLPEDTELIVVGDNGEALPLATEEAAEIMYNGDPLWCPAGVAPKPGLGGCSPAFTSFTDDSEADTGLLDWLYTIATPADVSKAGVIWVAYDYAPTGGETGPIVIDGTLVQGTMENFALTITGGWVGGTSGSTAINTTTPYSTFNVPFSISIWNAPVTINNLVIESASGGGGWALEVVTTGNIVVNNVDVQNNTTAAGGAYLSNYGGSSNVTVNDSTFNGNGGYAGGLQISTEGSATFKNVHAIGNDGFGAYIDNAAAVTPKAVTLNGTNNFSHNGSDGLDVYSDGAITLNNVTAIYNSGGSGAYLDNCAGFDVDEYCLNTAPSAVTLKGTNNFSSNGWDGLRVWTPGTITISNLTANDNGTDPAREAADVSNEYDLTSGDEYDGFGKGAFLHNYGAVSAKNIVLSGVNTFNGNASNGLFGYSKGSIAVSNVTASDNGCDPLFDTDSGYCAGAYLEGYGVTQTGYGRFEGNTQDGLTIISYKTAVTLNNLYVDDNGRDGVTMCACGLLAVNVFINGINVFTNNVEDGLDISSNGTVTLNNLTASSNANFGVRVNNSSALTAKSVLIKGPAYFEGNGEDGLEVFSRGAITTAGLTSVNNGGWGAYFDNCDEDSGTCEAPAASAVTLNGNNFFDSNEQDGLSILSRGAITVNNLTSTYSNSGWGALLDNRYDNAVGGITIKGFANTSFNGEKGLEISSTGAVTLANIVSNGNAAAGVVIANDSDPAKPANVTITGTNLFNGNVGTGLEITSFGTVLLNNLTANDNTNGGGANVDNSGGSIVKSVTLNGNNMFNNNLNGSGLTLYSLGAIKVNNMMASGNTNVLYHGAYLSGQTITFTGYGVFNNNGYYGLRIFGSGAVTLANITANLNGDTGVIIETANDTSAASYANVTLTGVNTFNDNGNHGLYIYSDGAITLSNITANENTAKGAWLDNLAYANVGPSGIKNITVNGANMFNGNGSDGMYIQATGTVSLTRITVNSNTEAGGPVASGVLVQTSGAINLTCGSMYGNEGSGYDLSAGVGKLVTIKGVLNYANGSGDGASTPFVITRNCPLP